MKALPPLLSFNAGYVDTSGFLALSGMFTAHVTGNFVTFGAAVVQGSAGTVGKLLVLPVFCVVIVAARLFAHVLQRRSLPVFRIMLGIKTALLAAAAALAIRYRPFADADSGLALTVGLTLAAAMAIQTAAARVHMPAEPPSTMMTGTTTQIMIDLADLAAGVADEARTAVLTRLKHMAANVAGFALGCGAGALAWKTGAEWCFLLPPLVALATPFMTPDAGKEFP